MRDSWASRGGYDDELLRGIKVLPGGKRWYWVVWPAPDELRAGEESGHLAEGYEPAEADAVDRALESAGPDAE